MMGLGHPPPLSANNSATAFLDRLRESNESLHRTVLDNGLVCLIKRDNSAPVVAVQIWVGTGSIHEGENLGAGLSHYMEHMIFKGTPTRGPADITRQIDEAGGEINAYTSHDRTVFYADLPSRNWKVGVDVLSDAVMNASLPEEEWQREKDVILREFAMGKDSPQRVHGKLLYGTAYRVHPYRVPVIGFEDVFKTMSRDHLEDFFHQHYVPDNMILAVVGDIDPDEVLAHVKELFKDFTRKARAPVVLPDEPAQLTARTARETGSYQVSRLHWTYHTVSVDHPDAPALDILSSIFGDGRSSILNRKIREELHLVHSINAWSHTPAQGGMFGISATFDPDNETKVIEAIRDIFTEYSTKSFTQEQIDKAKRNYFISELGALQTMSGQASSYASGEYYAGNPRFAEQYLSMVDQVDDKRLHEVLKTYILNGFETVALLSPDQLPEAGTKPVALTQSFPMSKLVLSNGIPLIVREDRRLPFIFISTVMRGGLLSESDANNGITQLTADLLTRGTHHRTADQLAEDIESRGASVSGFAGRNSFGMNASGLSEDREMLMSTLAECLLGSVFPEDELQKQKNHQLASIRQQQEQPMYRAQEQLRQLLFPNHPYRLNTLGSETSIAGINRLMIEEFFRKHCGADNIVISIFGDISADEAHALAEKYLGGVQGRSAQPTSWNAASPSLPALVETNGPFEQAILLMGYPGVDIMDPRHESLNILQRALSGLSSELAIEVREKRGLVYFIGALSMSGLQPGLFAFYAGTTADKIDEVQSLVGEQIKRICESGLRADEFERARAQLIASHDMSLQNTGEIAQMCALNELYGLGYLHAFELSDRLQKLTTNDIQQAAASLFSTNALAISRITPEPKE